MIEMSASEALYGFVGWLTTRDEELSVGSRHDAAPWAEAVSTFCKTNELKEPRNGWEKLLKHPEN
jgi:hypothetical protein